MFHLEFTGVLLWRAALEGQVFAPLALLPPLMQLSAAHRCQTLTPEALGLPKTRSVVVADQRGWMYVLCTCCGEALRDPVVLPAGRVDGGALGSTGVGAVLNTCSLQTGLDSLLHKLYRTSNADQGTVGIQGGNGIQSTHRSQNSARSASVAVARLAGEGSGSVDMSAAACDIAWCRNDGTLGVFDLLTVPEGGEEGVTVELRCSAERGYQKGDLGDRALLLPADSFSAPVAFGRYMILGCRDNHLYCLQWH